METEKIIEIKRIQPETVYNISVLDHESYTANGIVVHNCRSGLMPILEDDVSDDMIFENRDFSTTLDSPEDVAKTFQAIEKFNDKYRVSGFVIDKDIAQRIMLEKGFSVSVAGKVKR